MDTLPPLLSPTTKQLLLHATGVNLTTQVALVARVIAWSSAFDADGDALLCSDEVRAMPDGASAFVPRFYRTRAALGKHRMCLRYNQLEAVLLQLDGAQLRQLARLFGATQGKFDAKRAYRFQGVADYSRHAGPFMSQDAAEGAATFVYHGTSSPKIFGWGPADVTAGDIVSVRGIGTSAKFWTTFHSQILDGPYIAM